MSSQLAPCQCGYGYNWYCNGDSIQRHSKHEYIDRASTVDMVIPNDYVLVRVAGQAEKRIMFSKNTAWDVARKKALNEAIKHVEGQTQQHTLF